MNRLFFILMGLFLTTVALAQESTPVMYPNDTVKLGNLKIIKINGEEKKDWITIFRNLDYGAVKLDYSRIKQSVPKEIETQWLGFDLGVAGYSDYTKYAITPALNSPAVGLPLTNRRMQPKNNSTNVNIWVVQQKVNVYQHKWYFKYGVGFEMFNYYYSNGIDFRNNEKAYISISNNTYSKNKLFVNYLTVPLQLSRSFKVKNVQTISLSGGVSLGYMLTTRNKQISDALGKKKYYGDFNLNDYRMAGIFQLGIGDVKFYGSAALTNMLDKSTTNIGLFPYTFGIRLAKF
jgi:hypothetical protein